MKRKTQREKILELLNYPGLEEMSCWELVMGILRMDGKGVMDAYKMSNMNASLSGTLNRMVKRGELELSDKVAIRGGKMYKIKKV